MILRDIGGRTVERKNIRLEQFDYSRNGAYFVTVCTKERACLFWDRPMERTAPVGADIIRPKTPLSKAGKIVDRAIQNIPEVHRGVTVENYVVMPNHVHLLLKISNGRMISAPTLSVIIGGMKRWVWPASVAKIVLRPRDPG